MSSYTIYVKTEPRRFLCFRDQQIFHDPFPNARKLLFNVMACLSREGIPVIEVSSSYLLCSYFLGSRACYYAVENRHI